MFSVPLEVFMRRLGIPYLVSAVFALILAVTCSTACAADGFSTAPKANGDKKWRIAYYEGGAYGDYEIILKSMLKGFIKLGWIEDMSIPAEDNPNHKVFWEWVSKNVKSKYIEFVPDAFWTSNFDKELRVENRKEALDRLNNRKDIDLIIAMGTWAGQDLATNDHHVPVVVVSTSDPIGSHIVKSAEDSGFDHVHAKVDPTRYERQVRLFHDMFKFKRLGIVYEDSLEGRSFAAVDDVEKVAKERGFQVVPCFAAFNNVSQAEAEQQVLNCHRQLAPKVDAMYITVHRGITLKNLTALLGPFFEYKIPTFSMSGSEEVKRGVLLSIAQAEYRYAALFHAEVIAKILNGAKPRSISQIWSDPQKIAINLETAKRISYDPPFDIMAAADELYERIEGAQ